MGRNLSIVVAAALTAGGLRIGAQAPAPPSTEIVERAGKYVDAYLEAFSAVVSEEKQTQTRVRHDGRVRQTRETTADFLLVKTGGTALAAFRDVIVVDGKPIRNREDRLRKLFLEHPKTAPELARAIADESSRYDIGARRRGVGPMLPILYLSPRIAEGVRFEGTATALTFQEMRRPTLLRRRGGDGEHDLPAHGSFEIEPETGRVLGAEFTAGNADQRISAMMKVRYAIDPKLEMSVPVEVSERYWYPAKPTEDALEVRSTYSSFRKFQVTTGEQIKK